MALLQASADNVEDPLLDDAQEDHPDAHAVSVSVPELLKASELRRPLLIVSLSMMAQQLSGRLHFDFDLAKGDLKLPYRYQCRSAVLLHHMHVFSTLMVPLSDVL
jgi:hypothetical protein